MSPRHGSNFWGPRESIYLVRHGEVNIFFKKGLLASFGLDFYFQIFEFKDFRIKRRFSFPVLQVNNSLPFTMQKISYTNSEFFFLQLRAWE